MKNKLDAIVRRLYKKTKYAQKDSLQKIFFGKPQFFKPSADANLLIKWQEIFHESQIKHTVPAYVQQALIRTITQEIKTDPMFDFGSIGSLARSAGFGQKWHATINGSWFESLADWGQGMYPGKNLSGIDGEDFKNNITHVEKKEGFKVGRDINVDYYCWLNRYVGRQTGGSHHSAMISHQIKQQKRRYTRKAKITSYSINTSALKKLTIDNYMFVTSSKSYSSDYGLSDTKTEYILSKYITNVIHCINISSCCPEPNVICFIPKSELKVDSLIFDNWYADQIKRGVIIDLIALLENTEKYCTLAYHHDLDSIYLGDPFRENDKKVKISMP
jgi:hypothetical protein